MADDLSILQEIDESLRADKLAYFWQKFGNLVIAGCIGIVLLTIASVVWKNHMRTVHSHETALLLHAQAALQAGNEEEALHLLDEAKAGSPAIATIATLQEAGLAVKKNDMDKAQSLYSDVIKNHNHGVDEALPDFASLQQMSIEDNAHKPLSPTTAGDAGHAFANDVREIEAARLINEGKNAEAKKLLSPIAEDVKVHASERARAMEMLDSVEGQPQ